MKEQSQIDQMRAAIRGDRERALARIRAEGREPVFPSADEAAEPAAEPVAEQVVPVLPEAEQPVADPSPVEQPAPEPQPVEQPRVEPSFLGRLRALFPR